MQRRVGGIVLIRGGMQRLVRGLMVLVLVLVLAGCVHVVDLFLSDYAYGHRFGSVFVAGLVVIECLSLSDGRY